jgi:DNA polymerase-3 subunit epsilon
MQKLDTPICFIDFETTGIDTIKDEPIEFGAILVDTYGKIVKRFHSRIKLDKKESFDKSSYRIHGIDYDSLEASPSQEQVLVLFFDSFGFDYCFGAWNASFDVTFFKRMCSSNNMNQSFEKIKYRHLDVQSISKFATHLNILDSKIKSLSDCAEYFGISRSIHHNALEDAIICHTVYEKLYERFASAIK